MRRTMSIAAAVAVCVLSLSCGKTDEKAVVRFGSRVITVKQVKQDYLAISSSARPDLKTIDEKEAFAKDLVAKEILKNEAAARGLDKSPDVLATRANALNRAAWQAFYDEMVKQPVKITDKDLQELYALQNYQYHLAWILVRSKPLAEKIIARIKQGEDFGALASIYSIEASRTQGGDLGTRTLGSLPRPIEDVIATLAPGQVSEAIPFDSYAVIVKVISKEPSTPSPFDQIRDGLDAMARTSAEDARQREVGARLRKEYELTFNVSTVDMVAAKTDAANPDPKATPGNIPDFSDEELDRDLVVWKGGMIKVRDYVDRIRNIPDYMRPGYQADRDVIESLAGDYATGEIVQAEIKDKGFDKRPQVVADADRAAEEILVTLVYQDIVKDVTMNEEKINAFYEQNKAQLITEPTFRLGIIVSSDSTESAKIYDQLKGGADFAALAGAKSIDQATAPKGGELLYPLAKQELEQFPDLNQVVTSLAPGQYSQPMPVPPGLGPAGFMIVKLIGREDPRQLALAEVKDELMRRALALEQGQVFDQWMQNKMTEEKVEVYPDGLERIDFQVLKNQGA